MTAVVGEDVKMAEYSENQKLVLPHEYGCEILGVLVHLVAC